MGESAEEAGLTKGNYPILLQVLVMFLYMLFRYKIGNIALQWH